MTALLCMGVLVPGAASSSPGKIIDPAELRAWADEHVGKSLVQGGASSAALVITGADDSLLEKAWGVADFGRFRLASPNESSFRVSSITKVFSAVAIAQLVERGLINSLDDPVNAYLSRLQLPQNAGQPVTIHHLLTHSAGFDYQRFGIWRGDRVGEPADRLSGPQIQTWLPAYVRPPGQWAVYSNFGGALLGVLIEDVSGMALADYLEREIFRPLGMRRTRLLAGPSPELVQSYYRSETGLAGRRRLTPFSALMKLSMGVESSASDMGRFLRMLLNGRELRGRRILKPESVRQLLEERFSNHPAANGFGMIIDVVRQTPDTTMYMHNGSTDGFSAHLLLVPQRGLAAFVAIAGEPVPSAPSGGKSSISDTLLGESISAPRVIAQFVRDWISPYEYPLNSKPEGREVELQGVYVSARRSLASAEALLDLLHPPMQLEVNVDSGGYRSNGVSGREVSAGVFMQEGPWAYREMFAWEGNRPVLVIYGSTILQRLHAWWTPGSRKLLLQGLALFLLAGSWLFFLCRSGWQQRILRTLLLLQWPLLLAFPIYLAIQPAGALSRQVLQMDRSGLVFASVLANGVLLLAVGLLWMTCAAWRQRWWQGSLAGVLGRSQLVALCAAALALVVLLWSLNLLGYGL